MTDLLLHGRRLPFKAALLAFAIAGLTSASAGAAPGHDQLRGDGQLDRNRVADVLDQRHRRLGADPGDARLDDDVGQPEPVPDRTGLDRGGRPGDVPDQPPRDAQLPAHRRRDVQAARQGRLGTSAFSLSATFGQVSGDPGIVTYSQTYGFADTKSVFPYGMAYDPTDNTVLVGDYWNFRIQRYSAAGAKVATYKNLVQGGVGAPYDIAIDPWDTPASGLANFWVADQEQQAVVEFDHNGNILHTLGVGGVGSYAHGHGCGNGDMDNPTHLVIDPSNGNIYISNTACKNVYEYAHDGTFIRQFDWSGWKTATGYFQPTPRGIGMDENGNIYVLELNSRTIVVFNKQGQFLRVFPKITDMNDPRGLDIDTVHDRIYAVGALHGRVYEFDYQGTSSRSGTRRWVRTRFTATRRSTRSARPRSIRPPATSSSATPGATERTSST